MSGAATHEMKITLLDKHGWKGGGPEEGVELGLDPQGPWEMRKMHETGEKECESTLLSNVGRVGSVMLAQRFPIQMICLRGSLSRVCLDPGTPGRRNWKQGWEGGAELQLAGLRRG